jgi:hypothetical protein
LFFDYSLFDFDCFLADDADPYELPYQDILPNNPSFEQMREVVCVRKIRPLPSARWKNNPVKILNPFKYKSSIYLV